MGEGLVAFGGIGLSLLASTASPAVPEALSPAQSASEADRLNEALGASSEGMSELIVLLYLLPAVV